ncbi:15333_t:CDS:2, partial [Racocetra persica]
MNLQNSGGAHNNNNGQPTETWRDESGQPTATQQPRGLSHIMEQQSVSIEESTNPVQGNYPPTPIINNLIVQNPVTQNEERWPEIYQ